jgi:hypothetical protein
MNDRPEVISTTRHLLVVAVAAAAVLVLAARQPALDGAATLSASLTDHEFWTLTEQMSEPNGFFRSDNFLSNEMGYQAVIPDLVSRIKPGGVYLGVGPEQNFTYIAALEPKMAFIIDIRRGNLHEHLLYKALFEMSADRADFLSRLFSRARPAGLTKDTTVADLFAAYDRVAPSEGLYDANVRSVIDWLTKKHRFALSDEDIKGIQYVYDAFYMGGPDLNYFLGRSTFRGGFRAPTYEQLMLATDGTGHDRGYLASEASFAFLKAFERHNLLVPVVGDFGGPKAIRAVGRWVRQHGATVVAFYLSNVEQFLVQDGTWRDFCASVATLPLDPTSTYIYTGRGAPLGNANGFFMPGLGGLQQTRLRPMLSETNACAARQ